MWLGYIIAQRPAEQRGRLRYKSFKGIKSIRKNRARKPAWLSHKIFFHGTKKYALRDNSVCFTGQQRMLYGTTAYAFAMCMFTHIHTKNAGKSSRVFLEKGDFFPLPLSSFFGTKKYANSEKEARFYSSQFSFIGIIRFLPFLRVLPFSFSGLLGALFLFSRDKKVCFLTKKHYFFLKNARKKHGISHKTHGRIYSLLSEKTC